MMNAACDWLGRAQELLSRARRGPDRRDPNHLERRKSSTGRDKNRPSTTLSLSRYLLNTSYDVNSTCDYHRQYIDRRHQRLEEDGPLHDCGCPTQREVRDDQPSLLKESTAPMKHKQPQRCSTSKYEAGLKGQQKRYRLEITFLPEYEVAEEMEECLDSVLNERPGHMCISFCQARASILQCSETELYDHIYELRKINNMISVRRILMDEVDLKFESWSAGNYHMQPIEIELDAVTGYNLVLECNVWPLIHKVEVICQKISTEDLVLTDCPAPIGRYNSDSVRMLDTLRRTSILRHVIACDQAVSGHFMANGWPVSPVRRTWLIIEDIEGRDECKSRSRSSERDGLEESARRCKMAREY